MNIFEKIKGLFSKSFVGFNVLGNNRNYFSSWNSEKYLKTYEKSAYVYSCVRKRAEKVGEIEFELYNAKGEQFERHLILDLLNKPNPLMGKNEFFELYQIYKDLCGTSYIYLLRAGSKVKELHLLRPDWITGYELDPETGIPSVYLYRGADQKERKFSASDVIVSAYPSPLQALTGQSPLKAGALSIDTEEQLSKYHYNVLKNGGKVEGIINYATETLTKDQVREIKEMFAEQYAGADNSGKPLVTYGGATYQNIGLNPSELSFLESKKMTRDDILLLFQVPKTLLGLTDGVQKGNYEETVRMFLSETIRPLLANLVNKLDEFLVPEPLVLKFDDPTPEDVDAELRLIDNGVKNYWLTPNEAREMQGFKPIKGGDEILIPFNLSPMNTPEPEPTPVKTPPNEQPPIEEEPKPEEKKKVKAIKKKQK